MSGHTIGCELYIYGKERRAILERSVQLDFPPFVGLRLTDDDDWDFEIETLWYDLSERRFVSRRSIADPKLSGEEFDEYVKEYLKCGWNLRRLE